MTKEQIDLCQNPQRMRFVELPEDVQNLMRANRDLLQWRDSQGMWNSFYDCYGHPIYDNMIHRIIPDTVPEE